MQTLEIIYMCLKWCECNIGQNGLILTSGADRKLKDKAMESEHFFA